MAVFNRGQFTVMAMGNIIGSGIFLASSSVVSIAGIFSPFAYLLGGLIMMMEVSFIIEMTIANPVHGSFKAHAQEIFGQGWGFMIGWTFSASAVLGMAGEVIACAIFMQLWFPSVSLWIFSLAFTLLITIINLNDLKGLSRMEFALASIKIIALVVFIITGVLVAFGVPIGNISADFSQYGKILTVPFHGVKGVMGSMLLILFAYTGTGIIGLAATETQDPEKTVPTATKVITTSVVTLYVASIILIVAFLPNGMRDANASPFTAIFSMLKIPYASLVLNIILLSATLSALNSQVYSSSRMLFSLAKDRQAPQFIAYRNKKDVPVVAVCVSSFVLLMTVFMSYILPKTIFIYLISASGFLALVNWMSISLTHFFYRKKLLLEAPHKLKYKAPFYPYLSWICFFAILAIVFSTPLYPEQLPGLFTGCIILVVIALVYLIKIHLTSIISKKNNL